MNLLSKEDIEDGGMVFSWLILASLAFILNEAVAVVLDIHFAAAIPITYVGACAVRGLFHGLMGLTEELGDYLFRLEVDEPSADPVEDERLRSSDLEMYKRAGIDPPPELADPKTWRRWHERS